MVRVLLVANKTLGSGEVSEYVRDRMAKEECQFTLLVPATPRWDRVPIHRRRLASSSASASEGGASSNEDENAIEDDYDFARSRLEYGLEVLRGLGAAVDGDIGDPDPAKAIYEVLERRHFDEVALSTLPKGVSRWLRLDIPHQVERKFHIPVTVIKVQQSASPHS
jgi:GABA permease